MIPNTPPIPPEIARELWNARDMPWVHGFFGIVLAISAFTLGRIAEDDHAMTVARQAMAERQPHLQKDALEKAKGEVMVWFETTWPCKGVDINNECNLRERQQ